MSDRSAEAVERVAARSGDSSPTGVTVNSVHGVTPRAFGWRELLGLLAVIAFSIALRWRIASIPLERDEGAYAYIAQRWLAGDVPYRDTFDQKPPGVYLVYAALFALGAKSTEAIHWLAHGSLVGTMVVVYLIGRRLWSHRVGCIAALCTVVLITDSRLLGHAANTEVFAVLPLSAGMLLTLRVADYGRWYDALLSGVCGALALLCKQVTLPIVIFQLVWPLIANWWGIRTEGNGPASADRATEHERTPAPRGIPVCFVVSAAGLSAVLGLTCSYFAGVGVWKDFYDCVIGHNLSYSARIPLWIYGQNFASSALRIFQSQWPLMVATGVGIGLGLYWRSSATRFCFGWWVSSLAGVSVGGYFRDHYFTLWMPAMALLAASGLAAAAQRLEPKRVALQPRIALILALLSIAWPMVTQGYYYLMLDRKLVTRVLYHENPFLESEGLGRLLRENSMPDDRIFIFGSETQILFYANRASASRYIYMYPLYARERGVERRQASVVEELRAHPPKFVVAVDETFVPKSFLRDSGAPTVLEDAWSATISQLYSPFAGVLTGFDGSFQILRMNDPTSLRELAPDRHVVTMVVWERRD